jgi:hypothetical protein
MPEGTQRYERTKMVLPLRVFTDEHGGDAAGLQLAHTIDISPIGGRLGGLREELLPGQIIMLQRGQHKASFRVIWSKHLANHENQAGIEAVEMVKNIWGMELPQSPKAEVGAVQPVSAENPVSTAAARPLAALSMKSPRAARGAHSFIPAVIPRRALWGLSLGLFVLSGLISLSLYREIFNDSNRADIQIPAPGPPTADDLARLAPKPRALPVVVQSVSLFPRVQVAEAPTGRIVYPIAPDDSQWNRRTDSRAQRPSSTGAGRGTSGALVALPSIPIGWATYRTRDQCCSQLPRHGCGFSGVSFRE